MKIAPLPFNEQERLAALQKYGILDTEPEAAFDAMIQLTTTIFEASSESMVVTDADNRIITVNPAFTATTGYTLSEVAGKNPSLLKSDKQGKEFYQEMWHVLNSSGQWSGEVWNLRKNGELYAEWLSINVLFNPDGSKRMHVGIFSDITKKKEADALLWKQANYDHLTQLPNRQLFHDRLAEKINMARRGSDSMALLFLDLDRFKEVNDMLGHEMGDKLLVIAAQRIKQCVREMDTVARTGGDEFTVILSQMTDPRVAGKIADNMIRKLSEPYSLDDAQMTISASIGITMYPADGTDSTELLKNADVALYTAKNLGRGRFCYFVQPE